jgi:hypothetical protein
MSLKRKSPESISMIATTSDKKTTPVNCIARFIHDLAPFLCAEITTDNDDESPQPVMILQLWQLCVNDYLSQMEVFQIATLSMHCPAVQLYEFLRDHSTLKDETGLTEQTSSQRPSFSLPHHSVDRATELLVLCPQLSVPVLRLCLYDDDDTVDGVYADIAGAAIAIALYHAFVDGNREVVRAIMEYDAVVVPLCLEWWLRALIRGDGYLQVQRGSLKGQPPCVIEFYENNIREVKLEPKSLPALFDVGLGLEGCHGVALLHIHGIVRSHPRESLRTWLTTEFAEFSELWPISMWSHFDMDMASDDAVYTTVNNRVSVDGWSEILDAHEHNFPMMKIVVPRLFSTETKELGFVYRDMLKSKAAESPNISSALQSIVAR